MRNLFITILSLLTFPGCENEDPKPGAAEVKPSKQTGFAPVNGIKMYYEIHGNGKPLVLIHGGGSTIETSFGYLLPKLAEQYKVIAVELQAHGHTSDRNAPESFQQDADDVAGLLNYLEIDKADLFGFSNGGNTAMQVGIRHPELVNKLIIASAVYKREGMTKGFFEGMDNATLDNMPGHLKDAFLQIRNDSAALRNMFEKDKYRMQHFQDWAAEDLAKIKVPCIVLAADKDVVTPEHTVEMAHKIPNAELMILPGNHGSYMGEGESAKLKSQVPMLTIAVINEFLSK